MNRLKVISLLVIATCFAPTVKAQTNEVWMLGPMLHFNFGGEKRHISFALELAYWNYDKFPYSFDGGIEFEKQKIRLYSEVQTGIGVAGLAAGPLIEFQTKEKTIKGGFQGSLWGNYFLGFDLRVRRTGKETFFSPGTYFKVPLGIFGHQGSSSSHNDWHWDDDWD
jgi:hypothetical protein